MPLMLKPAIPVVPVKRHLSCNSCARREIRNDCCLLFPAPSFSGEKLTGQCGDLQLYHMLSVELCSERKYQLVLDLLYLSKSNLDRRATLLVPFVLQQSTESDAKSNCCSLLVNVGLS